MAKVNLEDIIPFKNVQAKHVYGPFTYDQLQEGLDMCEAKGDPIGQFMFMGALERTEHINKECLETIRFEVLKGDCPVKGQVIYEVGYGLSFKNYTLEKSIADMDKAIKAGKGDTPLRSTLVVDTETYGQPPLLVSMEQAREIVIPLGYNEKVIDGA